MTDTSNSELFDSVPSWLFRLEPSNAVADRQLEARIDKLADKLPRTIGALNQALEKVNAFVSYDSAANRASAHVWTHRQSILSSNSESLKIELFRFAMKHMSQQGRNRVVRQLSKTAEFRVRRVVRRAITKTPIDEVALPVEADTEWNSQGWWHELENGNLNSHKQGTRVQSKKGLPTLRSIKALRKLLGIKSAQQLGYFLLATDKNEGPYTTFEIPKRDGSMREICAPKGQLRWVQHQLHTKVLANIPVHEAAHGFIPGRSTVTNAQPHVGAQLLLKFDLTDFFPTIHYYRVMGLFTSLGYTLGDARFSTDDDSKQVSATLARLCVYTPDSQKFGTGVVPQGAPTSPAISNLVCRGLDSRLFGLAKKLGGVYTRYADDLTFSFQEDSLNVGRFRWWVDQICHQEGFFVNQKKFRLIRPSQRQTVTGIVVNDELRVPRKQRRQFRAMLHNCQKHGVESQSHGNPNFINYLRGFASYIYMVNPPEGRALLDQVNNLLGPIGGDVPD